MKPLRQTQAVVLKETDLGESDKLLTLFGLDAGKLQCIAKGAKRSKKRFVNKLELYTLLDMSYAANSRSLHRLDQAEVIDHFASLRTDYRGYAAAGLASEILQHWIKENDADPATFQLHTWTLRQLNCHADVTATLIFFFIKLLTLQGYQPVFDSCAVCGSPAAAPALYAFSPRRFGIVCSNCQPDLRHSNDTLAIGLLKLLHHIQHLETDRLHRLHFNADFRRATFSLLEKYFCFLLHRDLPGWKITARILFGHQTCR